MWKWLGLILLTLSFALVCATTGWWIGSHPSDDGEYFLSPIIQTEKPKPLLAYSIPALSQRNYTPSKIKFDKVLKTTTDYTSYQFSFTTLGKKMTGQLNVPAQLVDSTQPVPTIIMLRGYVPLEIYQTGVGTKNAAAILAANGFVTVAPDFFGYGESDPEPNDSWQARFEKPMIVAELLKTLQNSPLVIEPSGFAAEPLTTLPANNQTIIVGKIGIWAHSNGGQIALTALEVLNESIPTTLWAPVTAPFPYSLLFFSDENADEGKEMRKWISLFEKDYDVFDFSLTQHLARLKGPLQLHHGTSDDAALIAWSDEFVAKMNSENKRREAIKEATATQSAILNDTQNVSPVDITYYHYPGADHNLQPVWNTVIERDVQFFQKHL